MLESENVVVKALRTASASCGPVAVLLSVLLLVLAFPAFADDAPALSEKASGSIVAFESLLESPEIQAELQKKSGPLDQDKVHVVSHYVPYEPGQKVYVTEYFTFRSVMRKPARAVIFLTGPEFRGNFWTIPVEGYNALELAARRGFFAYTLDYVGVGESHVPADGEKVNYLTQVAPVRTLIDKVRKSRRAQRVDLVGEGYGAEVASELADDAERVRSVVLSVLVYRDLNPEIEGFFSPEFEAFLRSQPDGYWNPDFLDLTLAFSPNESLREYVLATQPGTYPTGPALQMFDFGLPIIDAAAARVPALIIAGELDPFPAPGDLAALARDWAAGGRLVVVEGAHHVPRIEAEPTAAEFVAALFGFIDE